MDPATLAAVALGLLFIGGGKKPHTKGVKKPLSKAERIEMMNEIRSMSNHYSSEFNSMPFLADFLTVVGYRESNFNSSAVSPEIKTNPKNAERGLFQLRPRTAFKKQNGLESKIHDPDILFNPRWSFVCAVYHIWDACDTLSKKGFTPNFSAIRRWWRLPSLADDYDLIDELSQDVARRFEKATLDCNQYYGTNIDPDFVWAQVENWDNYPGMDVMLNVYGLSK